MTTRKAKKVRPSFDIDENWIELGEAPLILNENLFEYMDGKLRKRFSEYFDGLDLTLDISLNDHGIYYVVFGYTEKRSSQSFSKVNCQPSILAVIYNKIGICILEDECIVRLLVRNDLDFKKKS